MMIPSPTPEHAFAEQWSMSVLALTGVVVVSKRGRY
jgi:hypothetical protein